MIDLPDDARLERAARAVLAQLDSDDLDRLLDGDNELDGLIGRMVELARKVLIKHGVPLHPEHDELLLLATLTRRRGSAGVHKNIGHAEHWLKVYLRVPGIETPVAWLLNARDSVEFIQALDSAYRAHRALAVERGEPPIFLLLTAAATACLDVDRTVGVAAAILDRGDELARAYAEAVAPPPKPALPVVGDRRFLLQLAGYAVAVREYREGGSSDEPLERLGEHASVLEDRARDAMRLEPRYSEDGPDTARLFVAAASVIDGDGGDDLDDHTATGDEAGGVRKPTARAIYQRLTQALARSWLVRPPKVEPMDWSDPVRERFSGPDRRSVGDDFAYADDLATRVVGLLTTRAGRAECAQLATWVCGRRAPDQLGDDLYLLLLRLRRLMLAIEGPIQVLEPAIEPDTRDLREMLAVVRSRIAAQLAVEPGRRDPGDLVAGALPPLWTARRPMINAVTGQLRREGTIQNQAQVVATRSVRGPGQIVRDKSEAQHDPGSECAVVPTANIESVGRCDRRVGLFEPGREHVCPARPWGERGRVESRTTIGDLLNVAPVTAQNRFNAYTAADGRWKELALADRP